MKVFTSRLNIILTFVAAGIVMPVLSFAGTVFVAQTDTYSPQRRTGVATVYLDGEHLRIDSTEGGVDLNQANEAVHGGLLERPILYWRWPVRNPRRGRRGALSESWGCAHWPLRGSC